MTLEYKARKSLDEYVTERRSAALDFGVLDITFGNFTADIGSGLGIGRYDYRPAAVVRTEENNDFLYPDNSYYNGVKAEYKSVFSVLYSIKKYNSDDPSWAVIKQVLAGALTLPVEESVLGATAGASIFDWRDEKRRLGMASIFISNAPSGIRSELAYAGEGGGGYLALLRDGYKAELWHYDHDYINPQSSGRAYQDENPVYPVCYASRCLFRTPGGGDRDANFSRPGLGTPERRGNDHGLEQNPG